MLSRYLRTLQRSLPGLRWVFASLLALGGIFFLIYYIAATRDSSLYEWFSALDQRVLNRVLIERGLTRSGFFLFFTYLGNVDVVAVIATAIVLFLILSRKTRELIFFLLALAASQAASLGFKLSLQRSRPDLENAILDQSGYAFPSGHALGGIVFYGLIGYYAYRSVRNHMLKRVIELGTAILVVLIGLSRLYLGVHWLSDVLAGWTMGTAIFVFFVAIFEHWNATHPPPPRPRLVAKPLLRALALVLAATLLVFLAVYFAQGPGLN